MMRPAEPVLIIDNVYFYATVPYYNWGTFPVRCLQLEFSFVAYILTPLDLGNLCQEMPILDAEMPSLVCELGMMKPSLLEVLVMKSCLGCPRKSVCQLYDAKSLFACYDDAKSVCSFGCHRNYA
jgi:hypothetical protein